MTSHNFHCLKCKQKFSIESKEESSNKVGATLKRGVRCPQCDDKWGDSKSKIEIVVPIPASRKPKRSKEEMRKINAEKSAEATKQAAEFSQSHGTEKISIARNKNMGGPSRYGGAVEQVPKNVVDSISGKIVYKE